MISSRLRHYVEGFDEIVHQDAADFPVSGLKAASVIRVGRLAVVDESILVGSIGEIGEIGVERLKRIKSGLASWLLSA
jgi:mRNA interferase MazF